MTAPNSTPFDTVKSELRTRGYVFLPSWLPGCPTIDVAKSIGTVVDMEALLPQRGIPTVQTLRPRRLEDSAPGRYSRTYGYDEFPLHTDLAHWFEPPHYFVLRCKQGCANVGTKLLDSRAISERLGFNNLQRALVRPRKVALSGSQCLLTMMFEVGGTLGFRWDSLFLLPMNELARRVLENAAVITSDESRTSTVTLSASDDTLIVDNWRLLHGRTSISTRDLNRQIERAYIWELAT